jgi:glycosyltransferase involved in cell wall biosynthesis
MMKRRTRIADSASMIVAPLKQIVPEEFQHKVREIEWGVDVQSFNPDVMPDREKLRTERGFQPKDILLIHFGSLRKWHGVSRLLKAFHQAHNHFARPVKLIVVGPSAKSETSDIRFVGEIPHSELPEWLKISDMAVLPFAPEKHPYLKLGFYWSPLKLFEAMAMELPLITLQHPRLTGLLGSEDAGFYFDGTTESLTQKMIDMIENLEQYKEKARQFRKRVLQHYSWEQHGRKLNEWLEEIRKR